MPRWVKITVVIGALAVCAGAGAYVAAHTNPFPPGVEDPGARPTTSSPTSPTPSAERWDLVMFSVTRHDLHEGGSCRSTWRTTGVAIIRPDGSVGGYASARLRHWSCDFTVAQVQTKVVRLSVAGSSGRRLTLRFTEIASDPIGSQDLGGFVATLQLLVPRADLADGHGAAPAVASRPDGDLGRYVNQGEIQLDCANGC